MSGVNAEYIACMSSFIYLGALSWTWRRSEMPAHTTQPLPQVCVCYHVFATTVLSCGAHAESFEPDVHIKYDDSRTIDLDTIELSGGFLVKTLSLGIDNYMRSRMHGRTVDAKIKSYIPKFEFDQPCVLESEYQSNVLIDDVAIAQLGWVWGGEGGSLGGQVL